MRAQTNRSRNGLSPSANIGPPRSAFLRLLGDPENDKEIDRLLRRYQKPDTRRRLLQVLQDVRFAHQLSATTAHTVSRLKAWFRRADRFRGRIGKLDRDYEALLRDYQKTLYPLLRAGRHLPDGYSALPWKSSAA